MLQMCVFYTKSEEDDVEVFLSTMQNTHCVRRLCVCVKKIILFQLLQMYSVFLTLMSNINISSGS